MGRATRMFTVQTHYGPRVFVEPLIARSGTWHLFLPRNNPPGAGSWSFCHLMRRDRCELPDGAHGFPFFGLCKRCAATRMWRERQPVPRSDP